MTEKLTKAEQRVAIPFTKMEGIGNDYVYINDMNEEIENLSELAVELSERHFGIGSDGLIVVRPSDSHDFKMRMYNLDGSEGRMCGNGIRCFAKFIYDSGLTDKLELEIETLSGTKIVQLIQDETTGVITGARVNMGKPILTNAHIPINASETQWINHSLEVNKQTYSVTGVSMGNPHLIIYRDDIYAVDLSEIGPYFEQFASFPEGMNTEFVEVLSDNEVSMRVWERGSGETLACGTGACAVVVSSVLNKLTSNKVKVNLLGGHLTVHWDHEKTGNVYMEGPARTSFTGIYYPRSI